MKHYVSNQDNVIDSRDVIERIEELEEIENPTEDESAELKALVELAKKAEDSPDWKYGETLIRYSYFPEYVSELVEDCGDLPKDIPSYIVIDWDKTTENLKVDYDTVDFDGVEYLIRL